MSELKPCPFCGGKGTVTLYPTVGGNWRLAYVVCCNECWAKTGYYDTRREAVEAWNWRHDDGD